MTFGLGVAVAVDMVNMVSTHYGRELGLTSCPTRYRAVKSAASSSWAILFLMPEYDGLILIMLPFAPTHFSNHMAKLQSVEDHA